MERFRMRFTFWLDLNKEDEYEIAEEIELLKRKRTFSQTIRDGIRLICDLRAGRTDVLRELFPWVLEPAAHEGGGVQQQLKRLEVLLLEQGNVPIDRPAALKNAGEVALEVKSAKRDEDVNSGFNFMISSAALQGDFSSLAPEIIEYGMKRGSIKPDAVPGAGPKKMDVPTMSAPTFDDLDSLSIS